MHDRRGFLKSTLGLATRCGSSLDPSLTLDNRGSVPPPTREQVEYEEILGLSPGLEWLGLPQEWSVVRERLHPFCPERVVILSSTGITRVGHNLQEAKQSIWKRVQARHLGSQDYLMPPVKFDLLVAMIDRLTSFYHRADLAEDWALRLARREDLGSCGLDQGFGLVHQFQGRENVRTINSLVDWWLFLVPEGMEYQCLDEKPVYALVGHVFDQRRIGLELDVWSLASELHRTISRRKVSDRSMLGWEQIANMDRVSAARFLNRQVALSLKNLMERVNSYEGRP